MFAINILESAWLLYFAGLYLFHGESIFIGQQLSQLVPSWTFFCENRLTCSFVLSWPTYCHTTPPPSPKYQNWCLQGCLQCLHFLSVRENSELFSLSSSLLPFRSLCKVYITMVLFIQYSVTCLCKFGLEKINLFMRQSVLGTAQWLLLCQCSGVKWELNFLAHFLQYVCYEMFHSSSDWYRNTAYLLKIFISYWLIVFIQWQSARHTPASPFLYMNLRICCTVGDGHRRAVSLNRPQSFLCTSSLEDLKELKEELNIHFTLFNNHWLHKVFRQALL